ncbi:MAG: hypothetical protein KKH22_10995 [Proteobacteria bacterium]|nr:hypothetical protein [Pseudomonadota bacterium]
MIRLPFLRGGGFSSQLFVRKHNTTTKKQSPEVAFSNTVFLIVTPTQLTDFTSYYFSNKINVAKA